MALDFSFTNIGNYFSGVKDDVETFFTGTGNKITDSIEENKQQFVDFTSDLKNNAKELYESTTEKIDKSFGDLSETASQKFNETKTLLEQFGDELLEKTGAVISEAKIKTSEWAASAKEWIDTNVTWENTKAVIVTLPASILEGFIDVGEGVVDLSMYTRLDYRLIGKILGVDDKWVEDIIKYDLSKEMYDTIIDKIGVNKDIAYSGLHDVGKFGGELLGYYALACVPYVGPVLSCLGGSGKSIEESINTQLSETGKINDGKVFISGLLGALEGFGFGKMTKGAVQGLKMLKNVGKEGVKKLGKETIKKFFTENFGKILNQTAISTVTDEDTYLDTFAVISNNVYSYLDTGEMDWSRLIKETAASIAFSFVTNIGGTYLGDALQDLFKKSDLDDYLVPTNQIDDAVEDTVNQMDDATIAARKLKYQELLDSDNFKKFKPDEDLFVKYYDVYTNPKYCNIETGELYWPQAEGAKEFLGMTDEDLFVLGTTQGIAKMPEGVTVIELENLEGQTQTRVTTNPLADDGGEYFGNTTDSKQKRALTPESIEKGQIVEYQFTGQTGYGGRIKVNGKDMRVGIDCKIVCTKTHAAPWFNSNGGAEQFVYYITDMDGKILPESTKNKLAHATVSQLKSLGIIK